MAGLLVQTAGHSFAAGLKQPFPSTYTKLLNEDEILFTQEGLSHGFNTNRTE